jgi:syntaxin 7
VPVREKKEKKADPVPAEKLAERLADLEDGDDDFANDSAKKRKARPAGKVGKENGDERKSAGARAAKAAKDKARSKKTEKHGGSKKLSAMAKAARVANEGLKRGHFEVSDDPSSHGSIQKHAGGRPAKRQARAMLHSRFDAAATPGSPEIETEHLPTRWPEEDPSPPAAYAPLPGARVAQKMPSGTGRYGQLASAAAAAAATAKNAIGSMGEKLPAGRADGAWSSAYRTLQAAHIKLQTKYDKLKDTKLNGLITEAESYRLELADHGAKAEELIKHFRGEADRSKEAAAGAEGAGAKVYELERENAELKETLLAYQGKILRVEQEAAASTRRAIEEAAASTSGRWGSEELEAFMGLRWDKQTTGVHHFTHAATGFAFQLSAANPSSFSEEDEETRERRRRESDVVSGTGTLADEVSFVPLEFGLAEGYLPGYLSEAIEFERGEMPEFVGRMLGVLNQVAAERVAPSR